MTLLLIDDDDLLRSQIRFCLEEFFENIFEASDKNEAYEIIEAEEIDVALIDLNLDEPLDGEDIAKVTVNRYIKTIIFTANKNETTVKELIKDGVFDYLNKPLDIPTLQASVKRAILFKENESKLADENIYRLSRCVDAKDGIKCSLTDIEKDLLLKILKQNDFNIYQTSKILGVKRENIYYFIKKYDIQR